MGPQVWILYEADFRVKRNALSTYTKVYGNHTATGARRLPIR